MEVKIYKNFLPTCNKFLIQSNPLLHLDLIFHKKVNKNKLKILKFQSHRLSSFSAIEKTITGVEAERRLDAVLKTDPFKMFL